MSKSPQTKTVLVTGSLQDLVETCHSHEEHNWSVRQIFDAGVERPATAYAADVKRWVVVFEDAWET